MQYKVSIFLLFASSVIAYFNDNNVLFGLHEGDLKATAIHHEQILSRYLHSTESITQDVLNSVRLTNATTALTDISSKAIEAAIAASKKRVPSKESLSSTAFTCQALPQEFDPHYFCSGVVDYDFIVPSGTSLLDMEGQARSAVLYLTSFINAPCLSDMKKLVCSSLYLPCVEKVSATDPSTFMPTEITGVNIPYLRPCGSLCVAVTHYGTTCGYIIEAFGLARDCLALDPYTSLMVYDFVSTPLSTAIATGHRRRDGTFDVPVCNDLPTTIGVQMVHDPKEEYVGEMCAGITEELYVPPSNALDPTLAPFLPPHVLQHEIEQTIAMYEGMNPAFWPSDCRLARREYMCSAYFSSPYADDTLSMFFGTVYTPSYTHRSVCDHYVNLCPQMLPFLPAYCDLVLPSGASLFPTEEQAVFAFDLGYGPMVLTTPPHSLTNVTMVLESECPYGTVVPEDPELALRSGIPNSGTACALSCPSRTLRDSEYDVLTLQRRIAYWFALVIGLVQMINLSILKRARQNIFVICAVAGIFTMSLLVVLQIELYGGHSEDSMCSSNASWFDVNDFGDSASSSVCTVLALFSLYQTAFMYWVLVTLSIEIWLRVTKGVKEKDINSWRMYYLTIMGAFSCAYALLNTFYGNPNVAAKSVASLTCGWVQDTPEKRFYANTIFEIVCFSVAIALFAHVIYVCVKTSISVADVEKKPLRKIWKSYSMIFLFLALHLTLYSITIFYLHVKLYFVDTPAISDATTAWYNCLFASFLRAEDETYLQICGDVPSMRAGPDAYIIEEPIIYFTSLVLLYITFYKEVREFWHALFLRFLAYAGVRFLALHMFGNKQVGDLFTFVRKRGSVLINTADQCDIEMAADIEKQKMNKIKPTLADQVKNSPFNPFAKTGIPRSISYLPDNKPETTSAALHLHDANLAKKLEECEEEGTERDTARESDGSLSRQTSSHFNPTSGSFRNNVSAEHGVINIPETIASESDAAFEHSIYQTLPSFNGAAEALLELALIEERAKENND